MAFTSRNQLRASFGKALLLGGLLLAPLLAFSGNLTLEKDAQAAVSIAVLFDDLVARADGAAIVSPVESYSVWEDKRIVTYTRVKVDKVIAGIGGDDLWVKTLGGVVEKLGQSVSGEPVFQVGRPSVLFVKRVDTTKLGKAAVGNNVMVVERGQGQYTVVKDAKSGRMTIGPHVDAGLLLPALATAAPSASAADAPKPAGPNAVAPQAVAPALVSRFARTLARDVLLMRDLEEAASDVAVQWAKLHPAPAPKK
jgi:hypothetical protein